LTSGAWDDRDPALSPDGSQVAFASHRDGNWDLYLLDLRAGGIRRLTETPGFEGHPTWSPDGQWLAYEAFQDKDYDVWILPLTGAQAPIQLTNNPAADTSPAWDPRGRRIAFVSDRDGTPELYLANLDKPDDRYTEVTHSAGEACLDPAFSPDGSRLAYSVRSDGLDLILVRDLDQPDRAPLQLGPGLEPAWSPDGQEVIAILPTPLQRSVVAYSLTRAESLPVGLSLVGRISRLSWTAAGLPGETPGESSGPNASPASSASASSGAGRHEVLGLPGVTAPRPLLSDTTAGAFEALRQRVAAAAGWDFLANLDYAFVGINDPLPPGFAYDDWLYTGRAFAFSQAGFRAGWVEVVREDFGGETYWRVFVRAARQDGSEGEPMRERPWDFTARYSGDPTAYDQGGSQKPDIPESYYVDFTELAADFGFERLPAMANWRTYYPGTRFNEFALTAGLTWTDAMLELYPPEAIITPTPFRTPTTTPTLTPRPTPTPWWWRYLTRTPTVTRTTVPTAAPSATP
jgi:TolB protein